MARATAPRYEWPLAVSVAIGAVALLVTFFDGWRVGAILFGCGVVVAGAFRLVLSDDAAGLLRVRRRMFDVVMLLGMGVVILTLAVIIPDLPR